MEKCDRTATNSIEVIIDFTRPDGQRTRPLLVDGKRLYVDEHYISVWSPVLRFVFIYGFYGLCSFFFCSFLRTYKV